jgi:hypothetical protein
VGSTRFNGTRLGIWAWWEKARGIDVDFPRSRTRDCKGRRFEEERTESRRRKEREKIRAAKGACVGAEFGGKDGEEQQMGDRQRRKSPEEMNEWVKGEGESIETERKTLQDLGEEEK